jgi:DNA topoisomerase VI subunit A
MPITISGDGTIVGPLTVKAGVGQTEPNITLQNSSGGVTAILPGDGTIVGPLTVRAAVGQTEPNITLQNSSGGVTATLPGTLTEIEAIALLGL